MLGKDIRKLYDARSDNETGYFSCNTEQVSVMKFHLKISDQYKNEIEIYCLRERTAQYLNKMWNEIKNRFIIKDSLLCLFPNYYFSLYYHMNTILQNKNIQQMTINGKDVKFADKSIYFQNENKAVYKISYQNEIVAISHSTNYLMKWMELDWEMRELPKDMSWSAKKLAVYPTDELDYEVLLSYDDLVDIYGESIKELDQPSFKQITSLCQEILAPWTVTHFCTYGMDEEIKQKIKEKLMKKD